MAQKVNPLILRAHRASKNIIFLHQTYHEKFLPYSINEQKKLTYFIRVFLKNFQLNLH